MEMEKAMDIVLLIGGCYAGWLLVGLAVFCMAPKDEEPGVEIWRRGVLTILGIMVVTTCSMALETHWAGLIALVFVAHKLENS